MDVTSLVEDEFVRKYVAQNGALILTGINFTLGTMTMINLDKLPKQPIDFAKILVSWVVKVNQDRIEAGDEPIMTLDLIKKCPIWSVVDLPIRRITTKGPVGTRKPIPVRSKKMGSFNKGKRK
jgi:hypothetical protein